MTIGANGARRRRVRQPTRADVLRRLGAPRAEDALRMALVTMVEAYERAIVALPPGTVPRGIVEGAFGKAPEVSRLILEVS